MRCSKTLPQSMNFNATDIISLLFHSVPPLFLGKNTIKSNPFFLFGSQILQKQTDYPSTIGLSIQKQPCCPSGQQGCSPMLTKIAKSVCFSFLFQDISRHLITTLVTLHIMSASFFPLHVHQTKRSRSVTIYESLQSPC